MIRIHIEAVYVSTGIVTHYRWTVANWTVATEQVDKRVDDLCRNGYEVEYVSMKFSGVFVV